MKRATFIVAIAWAAAACGSSEDKTDAAVEPPKPAPIGFTFEAIGDRSFASFGWSGVIHNIRVPDGTPFGVKVTSCDGPEGVCRFQGPVDPVSKVNRRRCLNRTSLACSVNSDCPSDGTLFQQCVYIYDVPTATPQPGPPGVVGGCGLSYIPMGSETAPTIVGTLDLTSGELNLQNLTIVLLQNGAALSSTSGTFRGTCMECIGDTTPNDGVKDGTCTARPRMGQAVDPSLDVDMKCDVHRFGTLPGFDGNYSMDCSPTVKAQDTQNAFGGTFTSAGYQITINDNSPDCSDPFIPGQKCFCGMCPDVAGQPPKACTSNADCGGATCGALPANCDPQPQPFTDTGTLNVDFKPGFFPEQCRTPGVVGVATRPNTCQGGICNWDPVAGLGTCKSTLTNTVVGCYPQGLGAKVVAPGRAAKIGGVYVADTGTARCTRSQSAAINGQLGLPGLTFQKRSWRIIPEFQQ